MTNGIIKQLKGVGGQLDLYSNKIVIKRKGFLSWITHGFKGEKTIYIKQIVGIQVKRAGFFTNGYMQFTIPGGNENRGGLIQATQDENTVVFARKNNRLVQEIKTLVENQMDSDSSGKNVASSVADEIKKLKQLVDDGVITEHEFNKKKASLLD